MALRIITYLISAPFILFGGLLLVTTVIGHFLGGPREPPTGMKWEEGSSRIRVGEILVSRDTSICRGARCGFGITMKILCISHWRSRAHFKTGGYRDRDLEIRFECVESARDNTGFP